MQNCDLALTIAMRVVLGFCPAGRKAIEVFSLRYSGRTGYHRDHRAADLCRREGVLEMTSANWLFLASQLFAIALLLAMASPRALTLRAEPEVSAVPVSVAIAGESK